MHVCPYCSHDNQHEGPCARCGLAGNPSDTPWGIRKDRNTKYWHKYNWDGSESSIEQEKENALNHEDIMDKIRPHKRDPKKHEHFTASQPAMYDLDVGITGEDEIPPVTPLPPLVPISKKDVEEKTEEEKQDCVVIQEAPPSKAEPRESKIS